MPHMLASLKGVKIDVIGNVLKTDGAQHAAEGFSLEHLWQNADDENEVLFLFRTSDLDRSRRFIERVHAQARAQDPLVNLPAITFLHEHTP